MQIKKLFTGFLILSSFYVLAENQPLSRKKAKKIPSADSVKICVDYLKKYLGQPQVWQAESPQIKRTVNGLIHYAEDQPIDSVLENLGNFQKAAGSKYLNRPSSMVGDSLKIKGFLAHSDILEKMKKLDRAIWNGVDMKAIPLPEDLSLREKNKKLPIAAGDEKAILANTGLVLPDSLKNIQVVPDSLVHTSKDFLRIRKLDELRTKMLEDARLKYNEMVRKQDPDSAIVAYRKRAVRIYSDSLQTHLRDSLKLQNVKILTSYNDSIVRMVNDSINRYVQTLQRYAENDSVSVSIQSLKGKSTKMWLRNNDQSALRLYIRNEQDDSLGIKLTNIDKHALRISIDDDVQFSHIGEKQRRDFKFENLTPQQKLNKINKKYLVLTPWDIGGNGTFGVTQTYLNNWKAGGNSAFAFLTVLKGYANYKDDKIKWENNGEFRNGWIRQGGTINQTQKNDDKIELISRFGISAFKKWYYSSEVDFATQFFNGYNYPDKSKPISSYMSPAKTFFKLGLDYTPNEKFSLFLSPLTAKNVFVRDTALVDQTKYGIAADKRSFWEPGLNTDIRYKIDINPQISLETKYKMFINYQDPLRKIDLDWENTMVAQLTDRINMTMNLHFLYDSNVTFPTGRLDADGKQIYKPKLQTRELVTVGFSYKINRHLYKRKRLD